MATITLPCQVRPAMPTPNPMLHDSPRCSEWEFTLGYVERTEHATDAGNRLMLYCEHGVYHLTGHLHGRRFYETNRTLTSARKAAAAWRRAMLTPPNPAD